MKKKKVHNEEESETGSEESEDEVRFINFTLQCSHHFYMLFVLVNNRNKEENHTKGR